VGPHDHRPTIGIEPDEVLVEEPAGPSLAAQPPAL